VAGAQLVSNRRRHEPYPERINSEPKHCVCVAGPDAHEEHTKPGRVAAKHFDSRCPHWDRTSVPVIIRAPYHRVTKIVRAIARLELEAGPEVAPAT
jgi:hypothetical protein